MSEVVPKNLANASPQEQLEFINSFDHILTDIDGVLWLLWVPFPGAAECINNFKKLGKKVNFITNYAAIHVTTIFERLQKYNFADDVADIVNPFIATVDYLKKINFQKKIYVIATTTYKESLKKEGLDLVEDPPQFMDGGVPQLLQNIQDDEEIGAVLYDFDNNLTYLKLQKALTYLKREDCLFLIAAADKLLPIGKMGPLLGNHFFYTALQYASGREPIQLAKPSIQFNNCVTSKLNITNPERTLFIGDVINEDMGFAAVGGYQKLLVLSGATTIQDINNWSHPEELKPKYYIENLGELNKILKKNCKL